MAFGFEREKGSARGYVNRDNPLFTPGQRLSRRQYDAFVAGLGERRPLPAALAAQATVADIEGRLQGLRNSLETARTGRTRQRLQQAIAAEEGRQAVAQEAARRRERQGAGQRRYNLMLDLYVRRQRELGRVINKREAARDPAFREAVQLAKGTPNPKHNPNIRDRNMVQRRQGFAAVGGADRFREEYELRFGRPARRSGAARKTSNRRNASRGRA